MAADDPKRAFNAAAPKTGHMSQEFNRQAQAKPQHYSRDVWQYKPGGTGMQPPGQKKTFRKNLDRYDREQSQGRDNRKNERDMIHLRDKFNDRSRGR